MFLNISSIISSISNLKKVQVKQNELYCQGDGRAYETRNKMTLKERSDLLAHADQ